MIAQLKTALNLDVTLIGPGGNYTAFVSGDYTKDQRKAIDNELRNGDQRIEQTCFMTKAENKWHGEMAGGEFCGAAALSLGHFLCVSAGLSETTFSFSGLSKDLLVTSVGATTSSTLFRKIEINIDRRDDLACVRLPGITHLITLTSSPARSPADYLSQLISEYDLDEEPAVGLMLVQKSVDKTSIDPWVWVREVDSLINETTCISGAVAVGLTEFVAQPGLREFAKNIYQPTGGITRLAYTMDDDRLITVDVSVEIDILPN